MRPIPEECRSRPGAGYPRILVCRQAHRGAWGREADRRVRRLEFGPWLVLLSFWIARTKLSAACVGTSWHEPSVTGSRTELSTPSRLTTTSPVTRNRC